MYRGRDDPASDPLASPVTYGHAMAVASNRSDLYGGGDGYIFGGIERSPPISIDPESDADVASDVLRRFRYSSSGVAWMDETEDDANAFVRRVDRTHGPPVAAVSHWSVAPALSARI